MSVNNFGNKAFDLNYFNLMNLDIFLEIELISFNNDKSIFCTNIDSPKSSIGNDLLKAFPEIDKNFDIVKKVGEGNNLIILL